MRRIAIIGSGIAGLAAAHALRRAGCAVTLYSDRTPEQWLRESRPTGTAARFDLALSFERELGLNHWDDVAPAGEGVDLTFCPTPLKPLVILRGRLKRPFQAVDLRVQCHRWMNDFDGTLNIESVTVERLDAIAREHDLTIVAAGRAELTRLFPRDDARSVYDKPQRHLLMTIARGARMSFDPLTYRPVKFDFVGTDGEIFFVPYSHRDHGPCWNIVVEAKPGSRLDRFEGVRSGHEALAITKQLVREFFPWDAEWMEPMELADDLGWLTGKVTPTVRKPFAKLPSGALVTPLGDTAISFDPIAAQGANTGMKHARHLVRAIVTRGDAPFDEAWLTSTFDAFWNDHGNAAYTFSNLLLEPITAPAKELLIAQYGSDGRVDNETNAQRIANAFMENFNDPRTLTPAFLDMGRAREAIGKAWVWNAVRGRGRIAVGMVRGRRAGLGIEN